MQNYTVACNPFFGLSVFLWQADPITSSGNPKARGTEAICRDK